MAVKKQETGSAAKSDNAAGDGVLVGRFSASRIRWQVIVDNGDKASIYRIFNSAKGGNTLHVRVDEPPRQVIVAPGNSLDVLAKLIRLRAGAEAEAETADGWYALVER